MLVTGLPPTGDAVTYSSLDISPILPHTDGHDQETRISGHVRPFRSPFVGGTLVVAASTCFATAGCGGTTGWLRLDSLFFLLVAEDEERTVPMFRLIWSVSVHVRYFLRRYMPSNIVLDLIRTRRGLKFGLPAMLLAAPYLYVAYLLTGLIDAGGPGWLNLNVFPDFDGLGDLIAVIGALLTFVLIIAVLMLIVCAIVWAAASAHGNYATASKARTGLLVALGAAALASGGVAWMNWLIALGDQL